MRNVKELIEEAVDQLVNDEFDSVLRIPDGISQDESLKKEYTFISGRAFIGSLKINWDGDSLSLPCIIGEKYNDKEDSVIMLIDDGAYSAYLYVSDIQEAFDLWSSLKSSAPTKQSLLDVGFKIERDNSSSYE